MPHQFDGRAFLTRLNEDTDDRRYMRPLVVFCVIVAGLSVIGGVL